MSWLDRPAPQSLSHSLRGRSPIGQAYFMDVFEQARQKIGQNLIQSMYPGGDLERGEYFILSPLRNDGTKGSFHIDINTGVYFDHATGEGGDFIDLVHKDKKISKKEAAELIADNKQIVKTQPVKKPSKPVGKAQVIQQTPGNKQDLLNFVSSNFFIEKFGKVDNTWDYINSKNQWIFSTVKFIKEDGSKDVIPFYINEEKKWRASGAAKAIGKPDPYNINKVKDDDKILIVEGEKCADCKVDGHKVVSWWGGTQRVNKTDWATLEKFKNIIIWPDYDKQKDKTNDKLLPKNKQPGRKAALRIQSILPQAKILNIYKWGIDSNKKHGWDIADLIEDGGDPLAFIRNHMPKDFISPKIIKEMFIDDFYAGGLKQFSGNFWEYSINQKYWRTIVRKDLSCNLQYWLDDTGMQEDIEYDSCGKDAKFISDVESYIGRHRRKIEENPFLKSATSPFINMKNGVIEIVHDKFKWHPVEKYDNSFFKNLHMINVLDFDFDFKNWENVSPEKDCPVFYKFIKDLVPKDYLMDNDPDEAFQECLSFIGQVMAYTISPIKDRPLFFGVTGGQETGKSFLADIVREFVGKKFIVERPIKEWSARFFSHDLIGARVIIEPDMKAGVKIDENIIKLYSGDTTVTCEGKNKDSVHGISMSLTIFILSNYTFRTSALEGLERRTVMIPFKNKMEKSEIDNFMLKRMLGKYENYDNELKDERSAIMSLVLKEWIKLCANRFHIDVPEWSKEEKRKWILESNTVMQFIEDKFSSNAKEIIMRKKDFYDTYKLWCVDEGFDFPFKKNRFFEEVLRNRRFSIRRSSITVNIHIAAGVEEEKEEEVPF